VQPPTECPATKCDVQDQPSINPCVVCKTAVDSCIRECGGGEECELSCKCNLKGSNPLCAECGSVDCGIDANDTADQARFKADQSTTHQDTRTTEVARAVLPPPMNPSCGFCLNSIEKCQKSCLNPGTCDDTCNCYAQLHNRDCKRCKLPACNCGHTCPRLEPFQRRLAASEAHQSTTYQDTPSTEVTRAVIRTPPINPCVLCQSSINLCMEKCANPGACDDTCNCYAQLHNRNCKGCKLPSCHRGQTCPRLELIERQLAIGSVPSVPDVSDALSIRQEDSLNKIEQPTTLQQESSNSYEVAIAGPWECILCRYAIGLCYGQCSNPGTCDDTCNCYARLHNGNCKGCSDMPSCNCGHTCPRLELLQRRLAIGAVPRLSDVSDTLPIDNDATADAQTTDGTEDSSSMDDGSEVQSGIVVPISPGNTCLKALNKCKAACANPGACDDPCNCYYRGARDCKDVKIPECKCGHTCPTPPWH
jgi:hypothetical protein